VITAMLEDSTLYICIHFVSVTSKIYILQGEIFHITGSYRYSYRHSLPTVLH